MSQTKRLKLKVMDREAVVFDNEVDSITSVNESGIFDVLEMHAQFITLIQERLVIRTTQGEVVLPLDHGIMKVNQDQVSVFLGMKELKLSDIETNNATAFDEGKDPAQRRKAEFGVL